MTPTFRGTVRGGNPIEPFGVDDGWTMLWAGRTPLRSVLTRALRADEAMRSGEVRQPGAVVAA